MIRLAWRLSGDSDTAVSVGASTGNYSAQFQPLCIVCEPCRRAAFMQCVRRLSVSRMVKNRYETEAFAISLSPCSNSERGRRLGVQDDFVVDPFWSQFTC